MAYTTTAVFPQHLPYRLILGGHIDDLAIAADQLFGYIGFLQPVIYTGTEQDQLHIFFEDVEGLPEDFVDLLPEGVQLQKIQMQEGETWSS